MILIFVFAMIYKIAISDCNGTDLVCKRTLNTQPDWSVWQNGWVFVYEMSRLGSSPVASRKFHISRLFWATSFFKFRQLKSLDSL